jgi:tetratricopeptide (TPR) repeat protein
LKRAIARDPRDFLGRYILGQVLQQQGRYAEAEEAYLGVIKAQPTFVPAYDSLARLLATCPDDKSRDGKRAVEYATTACERTGWKDPSCLDTVAAAYAEAGQFEEAVIQTRCGTARPGGGPSRGSCLHGGGLPSVAAGIST